VNAENIIELKHYAKWIEHLANQIL